MTNPGVETITILNAPLAADPRFNSQHFDWANATRVTVRGCSVQPVMAVLRAGRETTIDRQYTATHRIVFAPWGTPIHATSRVIHDGVMYEVDGEPDRWRDMNGRGDHVEAAIQRLEG